MIVLSYDIKIYERIHPSEEVLQGKRIETVEMETIRDLTEGQMEAITTVFHRHSISHLVKNLKTGEVRTVSFGQTVIPTP